MKTHLEIISELIPAKSKVLDIGCGNGELLAMLKRKKCITRGIELAQSKVKECVKKGLSVIHGDADNDLGYYPDKSFNYAVLADTVQATKNPKKVMQQALRVADKVVVSIPNFGYWKTRWYLLTKGRMPVTKRLSYQWYETPNIHFCTIRDFAVLVDEVAVKIEQFTYVKNNSDSCKSDPKSIMANIFGVRGVFVISK